MRSRSFALCDSMKERSRDVAAFPAGLPERATLAIGEIGEPLVASRFNQCGVMEFVPTQHRAGGANRIVAEELCLAVAELQLAFGEAGCVTKKSHHRVAHALRVLNSLAEDHVAATLAVNRPCGRKPIESFAKSMRRGECTGMELRIAARQPSTVAIIRWSCICKR